MKDSKNLVIGMLCAVVCIMAVAYAAFATTLTINGTATVASNWKVEITNITCTPTTAANGVKVEVEASKTATTAQFDIDFQQPGDKVVCDVTITNSGSLAARVAADGIVVSGIDAEETDPITYSVEGIAAGDKLAAGATDTYTITANFRDIVDDKGNSVNVKDFTKDITVTINYEQDLSVQG